MLEKIKIIEVDEVDSSALNLKFPPAPRSGNYPVIAEGLTKKYGDHMVFRCIGNDLPWRARGPCGQER